MMTMMKLRRNKSGLHWTDVLAYIWLAFGFVIICVPALWILFSSFKSVANLAEFPPTILPMEMKTTVVEGQSAPLPLFKAEVNGEEKLLAQVRRVGAIAQMVEPDKPDIVHKIPIKDRTPVREVRFAVENYSEPMKYFDFMRYFNNSVFVTIMATIITLITNSMAAFALSKYQFKGRAGILGITVATLMIPLSVIMVPLYLVVSNFRLLDSLWGIILPTVATPTGVFMLRQYMLTIPDELIDAARMDKASEWQIYWRIILPLTAPALAVLAIFSIMWRWNDFLWPLVVIQSKENFTLQVGLSAFSGELNVQWHYVLAMTMVAIAPVLCMFGLLQRFITSGIANTGIK